jgi:3-oxo-4-pregnene-20-carboxyl-CoA dehydrogenase beta subunit
LLTSLADARRIAALYDRVRGWADRTGVLGQPDVQRALAQTYASLRINELLNWQVAAADGVGAADASVTKVFASERLQYVGQLLEEVVGRHADPAGEETAELARWLDIQANRNTVLTFGGGGSTRSSVS